MPSNALIFVALVAGFAFLELFNVTRYRARAWEGTRLVLATGLASVGLGGATLLAIYAIRSTAIGNALHARVHEMLPGPYSGTLFSSAGDEVPEILAGILVLAVLLALILNLFIGKERASRLTRNSGDSLHALLMGQVGTGRGVALTLSDGKVYVGWVSKLPTLDPKEEYVVISPLLSGYRDEKMTLQITTNYARVYEVLRDHPETLEGVNYRHLDVLVAMDQIVSAHLFDPRIYKEIFKQQIPHEESEGRA